jgi:glycosyltransferase involved in cell wall biosynthesis
VTSPRFSFVVLSYNYGRYLRQCLESILVQRHISDFEVIVVDDASGDDSQSVACSYGAADSRVRLITHATNQGHIATVTTGLRVAQGAFVARIDADDRYRPTFARDVLRIFSDHPDVGLVYGDAALIDGDGIVTGVSEQPHDGKDFKGNEFAQLLQRNFICAPTVVARREVWLEALPIPFELAFHDWYFTLQAARRTDFFYTSQVLAEYRVHPANLHVRIMRDRTEEVSIFRLLRHIFGESEATQQLEQVKLRAKRQAYGRQYLTLAEKYFGLGMDGDARRCYWRAVLYQPHILWQPGVGRHLVGTLIGRSSYEASKALVKGLARHA